MKYHTTNSAVVSLMLFALAAGIIRAGSDLRIRPPSYDSQGRFWVYRNGTRSPRMPFSPYGWMSDATSTNLEKLIQVELECSNRPNTSMRVLGSESEKEYCIRAKFTWTDSTWASIAFISGPDRPPWWGETNTGSYYDLSTLPKKKLIFFARGEHGGECIQAQIGLLGDKPFGDSLRKPLVSEDLKLATDWTRYEMDLNEVPRAELSRICNGFGVIAQLAKQPGTPSETVFYIDDVYFE